MRPELFIAIVSASLPTLAVMIGILLNRSDSSRLDARITTEFGKLDVRIGAVESRLDGRITSLESRFHADMMQVIGKLTELEVRVTRLEEKQSR